MPEAIYGTVYTSKVSSKGQLTLPKDLRDAYHVREGETVTLIPVKEGILLKHSDDVSLAGLWRGLCTLEDAEKWIEELRAQWRQEGPMS